jgi:site-specific DNA-adenine methylase
MKKVVGVITVQNKKYSYSVAKQTNGAVFVHCEAAKINQEFLVEDIADLLIDLPNLIVAEKEYQAQQSDVLRFRVSAHDKKIIEKKAVDSGYASVSEYLRNVAMGA